MQALLDSSRWKSWKIGEHGDEESVGGPRRDEMRDLLDGAGNGCFYTLVALM